MQPPLTNAPAPLPIENTDAPVVASTDAPSLVDTQTPSVSTNTQTPNGAPPPSQSSSPPAPVESSSTPTVATATETPTVHQASKVTPYEYAVMSKYVYHNSAISLPSGWSVYSTVSGNNGYFGEACKNADTGEIVISHRGTDDAFDWIDSNALLAVEQTPAQFADAKSFIDQVKSKMASEGLYVNKITYTGHSLGGALAQMSSAYDYLHGLDSRAVVFDSPGITLSMLQNAVGASFSAPQSLDLTNYVAAPHIVNTLNAHYAKLVRLYPVYDPAPDVLNFDYAYSRYSKQQHDMLHLQKQFNPSTGQPYKQSQVSFWPTSGLNQYFRSYDANPHYWDIYFARKGFTEKQKLDFINDNLGGIGNNNGLGVYIKGDRTGNYIWGGTNSPDYISSGAGDDALRTQGGNNNLAGGSGDDTYYFTTDNMGKNIIIDDGGNIYINGLPLHDVAIQASNDENTYVIKPEGATEIFVLKKVGNDVRIAVNDFSDNPSQSVTLKDAADSLSRYGITFGSSPTPLIVSKSGATNGNSAQETLVLSQESNLVTTGGGADTLLFVPSSDTTTTVSDFNPANQKLDLSLFGDISGLSDITVGQQSSNRRRLTSGVDTVLHFGNQTVILQNTTSANISADNFVFHKTLAPELICGKPANLTGDAGESVVFNPLLCVDPKGNYLSWQTDNATSQLCDVDQQIGVTTCTLPKGLQHHELIASGLGGDVTVPFDLNGYALPESQTQDNTARDAALIAAGVVVALALAVKGYRWLTGKNNNAGQSHANDNVMPRIEEADIEEVQIRSRSVSG